MRIAIVHYAASPVIGGVERVIEQQAKVLSDHGHKVIVICGNEGAAVATAEMRILPGLKANVALDEVKGDQLFKDLAGALTEADVVLVHNMLTMPFNWAASSALAGLSRDLPEVRFVNWIHDVDVLREAFTALDARVVHVAVSEVRRQYFSERLGVPVPECRLIPNGVEVTEALGLTPSVARFVQRTEVLDRELVLVHPTRVLARKNIEMGLAITAALRDAGCDVAYVVTGAPDPHRKESAAYADQIAETLSQFGWKIGCTSSPVIFP
ncbi:glycosyltransferase family 4 protein [Verrucomicrobium spinosum]|uniref:glycosyltransferase family 4 protein n=1 Tax=Verrucomicrobium spinosum TaxID=2736 RepID=UPI0009466FF4|nr:glycosyltransferase family 4 protein [Verrucomicrobium spinosum]